MGRKETLMGRIGWHDIKDATFPTAQSTPRTVINANDGKVNVYATETPPDGEAGYAPGCTLQDVANGIVYINEGSVTSCQFRKTLTTVPYGTASGRGPSPAIWNSCPIMDFILDPTQGWVWFDDMIVDAPLLANNNTTPVAVGSGWWGETSATAGSTVAVATDNPNGEIDISTTTTDEVALLSNLSGHNTAGMVKFKAGKKTWFEARVAVTNVTNAKSATFVGFAEEGLLGDATLINADQAIVDKDFIAFVQLPADGDAWQTRYNTDSGGVGVNGSTVSATADVIVTTVYAKLGMYCDGTNIYFYVDGVKLADSVALATANVPDGEEMCLYLGTGSVDGETCVLSVDWVRVAQEIN